jgi:hypothetical protein
MQSTIENSIFRIYIFIYIYCIIFFKDVLSLCESNVEDIKNYKILLIPEGNINIQSHSAENDGDKSQYVGIFYHRVE